MSNLFSDGDGYLRMHPNLLKWINQCIACGRKGYKPEMPVNDDPKFNGQNLRRYFEPLSTNDIGLCQQCAKHEKNVPNPSFKRDA
ncbi:MAG: hypothetical protein HOP06_04845 [Methylotenera sp.]|nr:hypothetical protein [Methylotenera sp.]